MNYARIWDQIARLSLWFIAIAVTALPLTLIVNLFAQGGDGLSWHFLFDAPLDGGRAGGIGPLLISTSWILAVCLTTVILIGTPCALYLARSESASAVNGIAWQKRVGQVLDILAAIPSIVFGLFGYLFFTQILGLGFSILSGGLSLACMCLPLYVRLSEHALRQVPVAYRDAAIALNISELGYVKRILLPMAAPGMAAAVILSSGRALAETAVLIFTAGYVVRTPNSLLDSGRSLSVHIYDLAMNIPGGTRNAATTAIILVFLLIIINSLSRVVAARYRRRQLNLN